MNEESRVVSLEQCKTDREKEKLGGVAKTRKAGLAWLGRADAITSQSCSHNKCYSTVQHSMTGGKKGGKYISDDTDEHVTREGQKNAQTKNINISS